MALLINGAVDRIFKISTSKKPPSCLADSYGTPTGLHAAADKIGDGAPLGMVFQGRVPVKHYTEFNQEAQQRNLITTRIIRLRGLDPERNTGTGCDSYERYIYIHGTNHEDRIGAPFSGGCVEMGNTDVVALFNMLQEGDLIWIY